jgi:hypothetical protein
MKQALLSLIAIASTCAPVIAQEAKPAPADGRPCMANFTVEGSFLTGKTFRTWQEHSGVSYDSAFRKTAQAAAGAGWGQVSSNKDTGTITATQEVTGSKRKSAAPLNVILQEKGKGVIRIETNFSLAGGQMSPEDAARAELCKLVEAAAK